jgi:guanylate cyclase
MTPAQKLMHLAPDGIVSVSCDGIIEYLNQGVTQTFGHSPEQLLGQSITVIFSQEGAQMFDSYFLPVVAHEKEPPFECEVVCCTDKRREVPCHVSLLALNRDRSNERYVIVINDITALESRRQAAEQAKEQSQRLLHASLPEPVITRMGNGEQNITFDVPAASVMFLSLGNLNLAQSTPQDIMTALARIFQTYDDILKGFESLTKIKIFAESYICASGLFAEADNAEVEQLVDFAQNCLEILEDLNVKMYSQFTATIGVATGGPLTAGIIGQGRFIFDIIGAEVGLAALLKATAPPNTLQISEATSAKLSQNAYSMTRRSLVVRGTEYTTYLLRPVGSSSTAGSTFPLPF